MKPAFKIIIAVAALFAAFLFKAAYDETWGRDERLRQKEEAEKRSQDAAFKSRQNGTTYSP